MDTDNTPISELNATVCKSCKRESKDSYWYYCKLRKGAKMYFMYPCMLLDSMLCPRLTPQ